MRISVSICGYPYLNPFICEYSYMGFLDMRLSISRNIHPCADIYTLIRFFTYGLSIKIHPYEVIRVCIQILKMYPYPYQQPFQNSYLNLYQYPPEWKIPYPYQKRIWIWISTDIFASICTMKWL